MEGPDSYVLEIRSVASIRTPTMLVATTRNSSTLCCNILKKCKNDNKEEKLLLRMI